MSANPLRCPQCKEGLMEERQWPWKRRLAPIMIVAAIVAAPAVFFLVPAETGMLRLIPCGAAVVVAGMGLALKSMPDYYECPKCGRKKPRPY